jgi:hypothetical protein
MPRAHRYRAISVSPRHHRSAGGRASFAGPGHGRRRTRQGQVLTDDVGVAGYGERLPGGWRETRTPRLAVSWRGVQRRDDSTLDRRRLWRDRRGRWRALATARAKARGASARRCYAPGPASPVGNSYRTGKDSIFAGAPDHQPGAPTKRQSQSFVHLVVRPRRYRSRRVAVLGTGCVPRGAPRRGRLAARARATATRLTGWREKLPPARPSGRRKEPHISCPTG